MTQDNRSWTYLSKKRDVEIYLLHRYDEKGIITKHALLIFVIIIVGLSSLLTFTMDAGLHLIKLGLTALPFRSIQSDDGFIMSPHFNLLAKGERCQNGEWLPHLAIDPKQCMDLIVSNSNCDHNFFSFDSKNGLCFCVRLDFACDKLRQTETDVNSYKLKKRSYITYQLYRSMSECPSHIYSHRRDKTVQYYTQDKFFGLASSPGECLRFCLLTSNGTRWFLHYESTCKCVQRGIDCTVDNSEVVRPIHTYEIIHTTQQPYNPTLLRTFEPTSISCAHTKMLNNTILTGPYHCLERIIKSEDCNKVHFGYLNGLCYCVDCSVEPPDDTHKSMEIYEILEAKITTNDPELPIWKSMSKKFVKGYYHTKELEALTGKKSCTPGPLGTSCCIYAVSAGGSTRWSPEIADQCKNMDFTKRFGAYTKFTPHSIAEAFALLENGTRISLLGDSVQNQVFDALVCAMHREGAKHIATTDNQQLKQTVGGGLRYAKSHTMYYKKKYINITFFANYVFHQERVIDLVCELSDVLILNYGVHMNAKSSMNDMLSKKDGALLKALRRCREDTILIWRESTHQHFPVPTGGWIYGWDYYGLSLIWPYLREMNYTLPEWLDMIKWVEKMSCAPPKDFSLPEFTYPEAKLFHQTEYRDDLVRQHFQNANFSVLNVEPHWRKIQDIGIPDIYFLKFHKVTEARWDVHPVPRECTHICYTPLFYEPLWHMLILALRKNLEKV